MIRERPLNDQGVCGFFVGAGQFFCHFFEAEIFQVFWPHSGPNLSSHTRIKPCLPESEPEYFFSSGYGLRFCFALKRELRDFFQKNATHRLII